MSMVRLLPNDLSARTSTLRARGDILLERWAWHRRQQRPDMSLSNATCVRLATLSALASSPRHSPSCLGLLMFRCTHRNTQSHEARTRLRWAWSDYLGYPYRNDLNRANVLPRCPRLTSWRTHRHRLPTSRLPTTHPCPPPLTYARCPYKFLKGLRPKRSSY